jgi:2-polyprenyl-3-methyl-5-hydroxy-6-metoxy-1,4-benzoquinol methylase
MDDPSLPAARHRAALSGLARLNRLSGSSGAIWGAIRGRARAGTRLRLLDVASGSGDVIVGLARRARRAGVEMEITACDVSPLASEIVRERFRAAGMAVEAVTLNALEEELPGPFEIVSSSLFMHHLERPQAVRLLRGMHRAATELMVVDDLVRSRSGYLLAATVPRLVTRSAVVHVDAKLSVRSAFTVNEARDLAAEAGVTGAVVRGRWPARLMLTAPGGVR